MSANDDKYPAESGRRRFVKGVVGGATLAGLGVGGTVSVQSLTTASGIGGGPVEAMTIELVGGPAPFGMPQIPIEIDDEGFISGVWPEIQTETVEGIEVEVAREELGGVTYSQEWFQYCGQQSYDGMDPGFDSDNYFKSDQGAYDWQSEAKDEGDRFNIDDFADYQEWGTGIGADGVGKAASATWRSEGAESIIPVTIVRSPLIEEAAQDSEWLSASTQDGVLAWANKCTHFCCVPGYKVTDESAQYDAEDKVYCQCHQSVYDPFSIVSALYVALPRPN
ncbi:MAG: ubiquinol-cytochrome c reductase iron-sulfur subunit [Halobacteriota archaeon]